MSGNANTDSVLCLNAEYSVITHPDRPSQNQWTKCIVQLTKRCVVLFSPDGKPIGKLPIPDILNVSLERIDTMHPYCVKVNLMKMSILLSLDNESNATVFHSYLEDIVKTSAQIRLRTKDMIFASNNVDEECADSMFVKILSSLFECKTPTDLKHLLSTVQNYQNTVDLSVLAFQKPYYMNFVECLRYLSDELVTNELMQYAISLISGFDDNIDDPMTGEELKPTRVNIREVFKGESSIGKGKYGTVYVGTIYNKPEHIALKRISKTNMTASDVKNVMKEAAILYKLRRHPHIVGLRYFWEDDHSYYLVQDLMKGGELFNAIVHMQYFSEAQAQRCVLTLLCTLDYCHQRGIVHRDLKPENLLLAERDKLDSIRIADFGLANQLDISNTLKSYCGTPGYIAPEIAMNKPYGAAVDMWSLGVIAYILLCGYHPFPQNDDKRMLYNICHGIFNFSGASWADKSDEAKDFITRLLCVDPEKRMTAREAMSHHWMMFESRSTMNMNRAVQELERFYARTTAHAVNTAAALRVGVQVVNYVAIADCLIYLNPTTAQNPLFSMPRGTILSVDNMIDSTEGVWIHVFNEKGQENDLKSPAGKWVLAGRKMDNPICVPVHKSIYMSRFKKGKTFHLVKKTPTRDEPIKFQVPGGFAMIADELIKNAEGTWIRINQQSLLQFNVTAEPPLYVCVILGENSVLFDKIYGNWRVCCEIGTNKHGGKME